MISTLLIYKIAQLFAIMFFGFVLAKSGIVKSADSVVLSRVCLYLLVPAAIINAFDFEMNPDMAKGLVLSFAAAVLIHLLFLLFDQVYGRISHAGPVERASIVYPNAGNLIIPIVTFVLGEEWVIYSTAFMSVQLLFLWTHGVRLFSPGEKIPVKKILCNSNIISVLIGVLIMVSGIRLPVFVKDVTSSLGTMIGPVAMLIAGMLAAQLKLKKVLANKRLYLTVLCRMIVCPVLVLLLLRVLCLVPVVNVQRILLISLLASITPSASSVVQFTQIHGEDTDFATSVNIVTTLLCIVTMPLFVAVFMT